MSNRSIVAATCASLLLAVSAVSASALDVRVGGISIGAGSGSNGGLSVGVGVGNTKATVGVGGGSNVASVGVNNTNGPGLNVGVNNASGPLISTTSSGGKTNANVNLGLGGPNGLVGGVVNGVTGTVGGILDDVTLPGILDPQGPGTPGGPGGPGGPGVSGPQLVNAYGGLSGGEQQALKVKCRSVLMNPRAYDHETQRLCAMLKRLGVGI